MNAPINDQVKAEAAKTLLERAREKINLVRFFRYNASTKHGVPIDDEKDIHITADDTPPAPEPIPGQNVVQIVKTEGGDKSDREKELEAELARLHQQEGTSEGTGQTKEQSPLSDKIKGILQTLAVLGGLGAAGYAGSQLGNTDNNPNSKGEDRASAPYYSPYQYLEDNGEHLP